MSPSDQLDAARLFVIREAVHAHLAKRVPASEVDRAHRQRPERRRDLGVHGFPPGVVGSFPRRENGRMDNSEIDVKQLSAEQRLNLIEQIWDSLEAEDVPVTEAQKAELDRRIGEMDRDGERGIPWEDVLDRIRGRAK